jgi:signal transduction histidine kinase
MAARLAIPALAIACAITAVVAGGTGNEGVPTTYAAASAMARVADIVAGLGLVLGGALAWSERRTRAVGLLAMLAGLAWLGPDSEGWVGAPSIVRSLGAAVSFFFLPLLFHLSLALPGGRLVGRTARVAVVTVYAVAAAVTAGTALFRDPFLDPYCWRTCADNAFLVHANPGLASALGDVWHWFAIAISAAIVVIAARRLTGASTPSRRVLLPVLAPLALAGVAEAAYEVVLLGTPLEDPDRARFASIFLFRSLSACAVGLGIAWTVLHARRVRAWVARIGTELAEAPPPGALRDGLASALGDPDLEVHYWLPGSQRFVTADGAAVPPPAAGNGRAVTPIARDGRTLAVVSHDATLLDADELEREIGSAARLAIDNERLQAEVLAQLGELRSSRARIVEAGDAERRRLERNLHDGAQQRLLAVSYDLRVAHAAAESDGDHALGALARRATAEVDGALNELRELADGIYPAILTEAGLATAIATLADVAPVPVELGALTPDRHPVAVERTAYYAIEAAIHDAAARGATLTSVGASRSGGLLVVTVEDDGEERQTRLVHVADRIGALGGTAHVGPTSLRAELPCE